MCQRGSRYMKCDAERQFAYKVMRPGWSGRYYYSLWYGRLCAVGEEAVAHGDTEDELFHDHGLIEGGAFHTFPDLKDAQDCMDMHPGGVIVKVAVADYVASGYDGDARRTACYLRMQIIEEV